MTSLKTSIKTITYLSDIGCLEIQGASLLNDILRRNRAHRVKYILPPARGVQHRSRAGSGRNE